MAPVWGNPCPHTIPSRHRLDPHLTPHPVAAASAWPLDACFLLVDGHERITFSNAVDSACRPASPDPVARSTEVTLRDHSEGTDYRVVVRHRDRAARDRHAELGFAEGWGTVANQLARFVELAR